MTRTRPTMDHYRAAWDLLWLEAHWDIIEHCPWMGTDKQWVVFASEDVREDGIYAEVGSLGEAIKVARKLLEEPRKAAGE